MFPFISQPWFPCPENVQSAIEKTVVSHPIWSCNAASRTVEFKTSPKPRCQDHESFRAPRAHASDLHVLNELFPLRNIIITLPSPPTVLIGVRAVRFDAVSTLISPICVHFVQVTTSQDSKNTPPSRANLSHTLSGSRPLSQRVPSRANLSFASLWPSPLARPTLDPRARSKSRASRPTMRRATLRERTPAGAGARPPGATPRAIARRKSRDVGRRKNFEDKTPNPSLFRVQKDSMKTIVMRFCIRAPLTHTL